MKRHLNSLALVLAMLGPQQVYAASPVQAPGAKCYMSYANSDKKVCQASFYAVIPNPDQYESITLEITGYLRRVNNSIALYPSRDSYTYSAGKGGIELLVADTKKIEILQGRQDLDGAVTVIGKFTAKVNGALRGSVGVLEGDIVIFPEHEPGTPPPLPLKQEKER